MQITAPLSINNGAATPVAKSFAPTAITPADSLFQEKTAASSAGWYNLRVKYSPASAKRPTNRVDVELDMPTLASVNGVNTVAYTARFRGYFVLPEQMTAAERWDIHAFIANALDLSQIKAYVRDLDPAY